MAQIVAFLKAHVVIPILLALVAVGGYVGYGIYQDGQDTEELRTLTRGSFIQQVSLSGKVVPVDDVSLGFSAGGRVERVSVAVGDSVRRGAILAETDNDDIQALILQRKASLEAEEARLASLLEGARPEDIAVSEAAVSSAEVVVTQATQTLRETLRDAYRAADDAVHVKADQFFVNATFSPQITFNVLNTQTKLVAETQRAQMETALSAWESKAFSIQEDIDILLSDSKNYLEQTSAFLISANNVVSVGLPTGSVTESTLDQYATDVASARSSVNNAISSLTSAETALKNAETALQTAERNLALKKAGATESNIKTQQAVISAARALVLDAEAQLRKTYIAAPFSGIITKVDIETGEVASVNVPVIALISDGAFEIESFVPEINVALLKEDDRASVTLDAYGDEVLFPAAVISVDPAETIRDGVSTYRAILGFTENDDRIKAGMTANIVVTTAEKENVLTVPIGIVITRDGKKYVPIKENGSYLERPVTLGLTSSFGEVEILTGLSEGDVIVLSR